MKFFSNRGIYPVLNERLNRCVSGLRITRPIFFRTLFEIKSMLKLAFGLRFCIASRRSAGVNKKGKTYLGFLEVSNGQS